MPIKLLSAAALAFVFVIALGLSPSLYAEDKIEKAGVAVGVAAGNIWFLPIKGIAMGWGAIAGALSFVVTGGNEELTRQIWRDTSEGPYLITPEVARKGIGQRPEIQARR